jgi:flagellar protein FlaJ
MVILTTFIMVYMLAQPAAYGFQTASLDPSTIDNLLTTAVFDSFVIGIVAGKMGEGGLSDGFKHGLALVVISILAVNVFKTIISIPV